MSNTEFKNKFSILEFNKAAKENNTDYLDLLFKENNIFFIYNKICSSSKKCLFKDEFLFKFVNLFFNNSVGETENKNNYVNDNLNNVTINEFNNLVKWSNKNMITEMLSYILENTDDKNNITKIFNNLEKQNIERFIFLILNNYKQCHDRDINNIEPDFSKIKPEVLQFFESYIVKNCSNILNNYNNPDYYFDKIIHKLNQYVQNENYTKILNKEIKKIFESDNFIKNENTWINIFNTLSKNKDWIEKYNLEKWKLLFDSIANDKDNFNTNIENLEITSFLSKENISRLIFTINNNPNNLPLSDFKDHLLFDFTNHNYDNNKVAKLLDYIIDNPKLPINNFKTIFSITKNNDELFKEHFDKFVHIFENNSKNINFIDECKYHISSIKRKYEVEKNNNFYMIFKNILKQNNSYIYIKNVINDMFNNNNTKSEEIFAKLRTPEEQFLFAYFSTFTSINRNPFLIDFNNNIDYHLNDILTKEIINDTVINMIEIDNRIELKNYKNQYSGKFKKELEYLIDSDLLNQYKNHNKIEVNDFDKYVDSFIQNNIKKQLNIINDIRKTL